MIAGTFPPNQDGVLSNNGAGVLSWVPRLDINGLTAKSTVSSNDQLPVYAGSPISANRKVTAAALADYVAFSDPLLRLGDGAAVAALWGAFIAFMALRGLLLRHRARGEAWLVTGLAR